VKLGRAFQYGARQPDKFLALLFNLPKLIRLHIRLLKDPRVPLWPKLIFGAALAYVVSPVDLIPDFLVPVFGAADDVVVLIAASRYFLQNCPPEVLQEHVRALDAEGKIDLPVQQ